MAESQEQRGDLRPIPDPSALTTEATHRLEVMLRGLINTEIRHENELVNQKFEEIKTILRLLDARMAEQKSDTKAALDAALAAQKEQVASQNASAQKSIDKSENTTTERIKGVEALLATSSKATDDKISDLKDRVIAIEAIKLGNTEGAATIRQSGTDMRALIAILVSVAFLLIAIASIAIAILKP